MRGIKLGLIGLGIMAIIALAAVPVFAAVATGDTSQYQPIIQKLAEKFNLDPDDVKAVFDEAKSEREADMQKQLEKRLDQAVKDEKITEVQKEAILAKIKEMRDDRREFRDLDPDKRQAEMKKRQEELSRWAKKNGIDQTTLEQFMPGRGGFPGGRHGPGCGPGGGRMEGFGPPPGGGPGF